MNLKEKLIRENKTRWLDIGCNKNFEESFYYMDVFPKININKKFRDKYFRLNILRAKSKQLFKLKKFDLVRMQHVIEHFSYEEGLKILNNIYAILKNGGFLLLTVPDLNINISKYKNKKYKSWASYKKWAEKRIPKNAPDSFYFSVFCHNLTITPHKWCYDADGLKFLLKLTNKFNNIKELKLNNKLSSFPFTHNRPEEDLCIVANKKYEKIPEYNAKNLI